MIRSTACTVLVFAAASLLSAQESTSDSQRQSRSAWLKEHAIALRSIDPSDEDFSDLEPLKKTIGTARIVQLGEQSHGDGATFHAKARLIKFLHQEMGFDVLAMESGLYDCRKAWQALKGGKEPYAAVTQGVFGIWTGSEQFQPVIDYLGKTAKSERPLELCGFDCQFTAEASQTLLPDDLQSVVDRLGSGVIDEETRAGLREEMQAMAGFQTATDDASNARRMQLLKTFRRALDAAQASPQLPAEELAFWRQYSASLEAAAEQKRLAVPRDFASAKKSGSVRDAQMARNLIWLAKEAYPERKIIVWAASFHLMRNADTVRAAMGDIGTNGEGPRDQVADLYREVVTMGDGVWKALRAETYTLAFLAAEGEIGRPGMVPQKLRALERGSLEDLLVAAECRNVIVDFRGMNDSGAWLKQPLVAAPLGYIRMTSDWTNVFDGVVFTRTMYPSTRSARSRPTASATQRFAESWTGPRGGSHEAGADSDVKHGGQRSAYLRSVGNGPGGFGTLVQGLGAEAYRGKRLRYSGYVKAENVAGKAGLWLRIDGREKTGLAFDNMLTRPIQGTSEWTQYAVVLDVPEEATDMTFGVLMQGQGRIWVDDLQFEVVGTEIATTAMAAPSLPRQGKIVENRPKEPKNMGFEQ